MPSKSKRTTVYSLSDELNVSVATVSKALNGSPEISAALRKKVCDLAAKRNFKPRIVSRKVPNICILIQQYSGHALDFGMFMSTVMEGVSQYVQEEGLEMSIYADSIDKLNSCDIVRELRRRLIDGAIVVRSTEQSAYLKSLEAENFPYCVLFGSRHERGIAINNDEIGYRATRHLIDKGHRQIGLLLSPSNSASSQGRFEGYCRAIKEAGIAFEERLVARNREDRTGLEFGCEGIQALVRDNPSMTAAFGLDLSVVLGLLHGVSRMGLSVPGDLSVISCDDYPEAAYLNPPLTVVDIPNRALGYEAARRVYRLIRGLEPLPIGDHVDLNGRIIERESIRSL
jgi:LacI family transcriptional regulator